MKPLPPEPAKPAPVRLMSLDAYRGFVMLLMVSEMMRIPQVAKSFEGSRVAAFIGFHFSHVEWTGISLWDLIQPSFMFMVGVALPFSVANRQNKGENFAWTFLHTLWRSFVLVALGVFLRSLGKSQTNFTFVDVLSQIGLGYPFLFLLAYTKPRWQLAAAVVILVGYWLLFALWPLPSADFDYKSRLNIEPEWVAEHNLSGFAAHWNKNTNPAHAFDFWFLNLFPAKDPLFPEKGPFEYNSGGYQTLNFIPSLATMIFGLLAGGLLCSNNPGSVKFGGLFFGCMVCLFLGSALALTGICPSVKRIWTPAWALYSTGWTLFLLAGFYCVIDLMRIRFWAFPLVVVGMNSIAMYCLEKIAQEFISANFKTHLGKHLFEVFGSTWEPFLRGGTVLVVFWLILYWMYRRKIFLRV